MKQFAVIGLHPHGLFVYCRLCFREPTKPGEAMVNYRLAAVADDVSIEGLDADDLVRHNAEHHPAPEGAS